ncbi:MAG: hypothetical protein WBN68_15735 [Sedimenticolaceae bacterium]
MIGICSAIIPLFAYALFGSSRQLKRYRFQTLKQATKACLKHQRRKGLVLVDRGVADPESDDREWREHVESPRMENQDSVPAPPAQEEPTPPA